MNFFETPSRLSSSSFFQVPTTPQREGGRGRQQPQPTSDSTTSLKFEQNFFSLLPLLFRNLLNPAPLQGPFLLLPRDYKTSFFLSPVLKKTVQKQVALFEGKKEKIQFRYRNLALQKRGGKEGQGIRGTKLRPRFPNFFLLGNFSSKLSGGNGEGGGSSQSIRLLYDDVNVFLEKKSPSP